MRTRNNTDGNKLVIFSRIALYYDDIYILFQDMKVGVILCTVQSNVCTCETCAEKDSSRCKRF